MSSFDLAASHRWERVWIVKWTDVSQGYHFPCEKRYPTRRQARAHYKRFSERKSFYYSGAMASFCPFRDVRIIRER